jgi:peptide/nickel transport system substrate-binding protein
MPEASRLGELSESWLNASTSAERRRIWHEMLSIHAEQVFSIGIVAGVKQPVVARQTLRNLPEEGVYNWDPGAHFGLYRPDTFWFDERG